MTDQPEYFVKLVSGEVYPISSHKHDILKSIIYETRNPRDSPSKTGDTHYPAIIATSLEIEDDAGRRIKLDLPRHAIAYIGDRLEE